MTASSPKPVRDQACACSVRDLSLLRARGATETRPASTTGGCMSSSSVAAAEAVSISAPCALVVPGDDHDVARLIVPHALQAEGLLVRIVRDADEALALLDERAVALVLDLR